MTYIAISFPEYENAVLVAAALLAVIPTCFVCIFYRRPEPSNDTVFVGAFIID